MRQCDDVLNWILIEFQSIMFQRKRAALEVTQGLLSFGNEDDITINDALMAFEQETDKPSVLGTCIYHPLNVYSSLC